MSEPLTSTSAAASAVAGTAIAGLMVTHSGVIGGAFTGAALFVLISNDYTIGKKVGFLFLSFLAGIISADFTTGLIDHITPAGVPVPVEFGALFASSTVVLFLTLLHWLVKNPAKILSVWRGNHE